MKSLFDSLTRIAFVPAVLFLNLSDLRGAVTFQAFSSSSSTAFVHGPDAFVFTDESIAVKIKTNNQRWRVDDVDIKWGSTLGFGVSPAAVDFLTTGTPYGGGSTTSTPLVGANNVPANTTVNYTPGSSITLAPLTEFWIFLHVPAGDGDYSVATSPVSQASGPWSIQDVQARQSGVTLNSLSNTPQITINATVVPEPTSLLSAAFGCLFLASRRRRNTFTLPHVIGNIQK